MSNNTLLQRIALSQEDPEQFLDDLIVLKQESEEASESVRRFEMTLELDIDDLNQAIEEVIEVVETDG